MTTNSTDAVGSGGTGTTTTTPAIETETAALLGTVVETTDTNIRSTLSNPSPIYHWRLFAAALMLKLLLVPSYHSTDFEVHRNWLAITSNRPLDEWYYESTSEWTLDYPPFFAWFEWILSKFALLFDHRMLLLDNLGYSSFETILFQRLTVMATEAIFFAGVIRLLHAMKVPRKNFEMFLALVFLNPGILFVDHIHFQYNAFMYGIQLFSIAFMFEGRHRLGAFLFAVVLNFKHIYLYHAPAYFIYLLSGFCFVGKYRLSLWRLCSLGLIVVSVFLLSFGPFAAHLEQVVSRLFPFKRVASITGKVDLGSSASLTRGLVGDSKFSILPAITPFHTVLLTIASQLPILVKLWFNPKPIRFLDAIILCGFGSYMLGWHVHEKAILLVLIPLSFVATNGRYTRPFLIASVAGYYSLFPLLFESKELVTKVRESRRFSLNKIEKLYLAGFIPLLVHTELLHPLVFDHQFEFLPRMAVSVYTALGIVYSWIRLYGAALYT
ncbi:hypothetical protein BSLG_000483 [Batrachochytrium salamandrivorans]|nr:hypothetical protein BSLG_000483 [Batrachochytrium salamandrivorans]